MDPDIDLTPAQLREALTALLDAFPSEGALARLTTLHLGENLAVITTAGSLRDVVFELLMWARAHGRQRELLRAAREENPGNPRLAAFVGALTVVAPTPTTQNWQRDARTVLAELYPTPVDVARVLADAGIARARVDFTGSVQNVWFNALEEAARSGRLDALLAVAAQEYPRHPALQQLVRAPRA
jgi:Effector-associated domain 1